MKIKGNIDDRTVFVGDRKLYPDLSQKLYNHSPDGFMWGYGGSGPAQLALALMLMVTDEDTAQKLYQDFKAEKIATLPQKDFEVDIDVEAWVRAKGEKVSRLNYEKSLRGSDVQAAPTSSVQCTPGHGDRCQNAIAEGCDCDCAGRNHGINVHQSV